MNQLVFFITLAALAWVAPVWVVVPLCFVYGLRYGFIELLVMAVCLDWYLQPAVPTLTLLVAALAIVTPYIRSRTTLYST